MIQEKSIHVSEFEVFVASKEMEKLINYHKNRRDFFINSDEKLMAFIEEEIISFIQNMLEKLKK